MSFSKRPGKNTPQCYTKPLDSLKNWNNCFFWVDEHVFSTVVDCRTNASKDRMPVNGTYFVEAVRVLDTHRTPIQKQPEMLLCLVRISRRYYLGNEVYAANCFLLIAEMDLFSLIRATNPTKVIDMDEPAVATNSSGVQSTIEKSPLDFANEDGASDQGTAAPEMPPPEDVPATAAPGVGQAEKAVAAEPPVARSSHGEKSLAAMQLCLASNVFVTEGAPANVSDPDPLSFANAPSHHPVDVSQSSPGVFAAEDPESENASFPTEVGSFEPEAKLLRKFVAQVARRDKRIETLELEIKNLEALLETEADMKRAAEDKSAGLIKDGEEKLKAAFEQFKQYEDERVERRCAELDARLDALSIDFDEELYPHMLIAIESHMWVVGHGLRLAMMKCAESLEMRQSFADVVFARVAKGMSEGLKHGVEHGQDQLTVESIEAYDPEAKAKFVAALQSLKDLKYPLLDQLEGLKDAPMDVIMAALYLESDTGGMPHNIYATFVPAPLSSPSPCTWRSDGVPVSVPTVVPQGLALLLVDAARQTDLEDA
nr:transposase (putative), gypsy type [Tanacetum cinerariifolium]